MNPRILKLIFHIGSIIKTIKDIEHAVSDLVKGEFGKEDVEPIIADLQKLIEGGVITIPGMTGEEVSKALMDLKNSF